MATRNVRWAETNASTDSREEGLFSEVNKTNEETSDDVEGFELCLTMMCTNGRLACSYFDPVVGVLYTMQDTDENRHYDLTIRILEQLSPALVLTSSKSDELFMDAVREHMENIERQFQVRPWKEFTAARGLARLQALPLLASALLENDEVDELDDSEEPTNAYDFMRRRQRQVADPTLTHWNAGVRLGNFTADGNESLLCFSTIGALLDHLVRAKAVHGGADDVGGLVDIMGIEYMALEDIMQINADALVSLQIFLNERHASVYSDVTKEGLSIYGILNQTRTPAGASVLRQWLLRPSTSLDIIRQRHDAIACLVHPDNITVAERMHKSIGGLKGGPSALTKLRKGKATLQNWKSIVHHWAHSAMLRASILELSHSADIPVLRQLTKLIDNSTFIEVAGMIDDTIDWEESFNIGRITVKPMVDEKLDEWKETLAGIDSLLSRVAQAIAAEIPREQAEVYKEVSVIYFPQLGYLIAVPIRAGCPDSEQRKGLDGWTFQFITDESVYFKSQKMHEMDYHIGDINTYIVDREIDILQQLQQEVLEHAESITAICERAGVLDCLLCFAAASNQYQWIRPTMCDDIVIDIREGRHPLQELVDDRFVANDTYAIGRSSLRGHAEDGSSSDEGEVSDGAAKRAENGNSVVICTGANASGKSVYLKQCALIPYMAQIGCFVPATSARLGVIEKVFTRIQTRESVSKMQSAFMIDLNQVSLALRNMSSPRSLLILDEFGKGTLAADGAGLFTGVIKSLLRLGNSCPLVFAATHFHEVLNAEILSPALPISFVHMAVMITTDNGDVLEAHGQQREDGSQSENEGHQIVRPGEAVAYLFKVSEGLCLHSHASKCALTWGIPPRIVRRSEYVSELLSRNELNLLLDEQMSEKEREELVGCEAICRRFMEWDLEGFIERRKFGPVRLLLADIVEGAQGDVQNSL